MMGAVLLRGFVALLFSCAAAFIMYQRDGLENGTYESDKLRQRYLPYLPPFVLPLYVLLLFTFIPLTMGYEKAYDLTLSICFQTFLHICVYYIFLILALPLLRRWISARACAMLWMLPNYLYILQNDLLALPEPRWILRIPNGTIQIAVWIWTAGFWAVLLWKIASHLIFRRMLFKNAWRIQNPAVLTVWNREEQSAELKKPVHPPVVSPALQAPLSIGFFPGSIRVVLPDRTYSEDELALIFRHELIHIGRQDSMTKFFLTFCTAMCWFNPLMWLAVRKSAEDLELSCDETVLLGTGTATRRQYAELLLRTAGDARGFTTCLSASAAAMRYRLKHIVAPRERFLGGVAVGLVFFTLVMTCGYVSLAYETDSGQRYIFQSEDPAAYTIHHVSWGNKGEYSCLDEAALNGYLAGLQFSKITGNYHFPEEGYQLSVVYTGPRNGSYIVLRGNRLSVSQLGDRYSTTTYLVNSDIDWMYLYSLLTPRKT